MSPDDPRIREAILSLLAARDAGRTICPSEVARVLAPAGWRPLMPAVRAVARTLARAGALEIRQRGVTVAPDVETVGPIRLALPTSPMSGRSSE